MVKEEEVSAIIMALDSKKSSGPSDINAKCLQVSLSSILPSNTRIINNSLMTGIVPDSWKMANVTPVFKNQRRQNESK